LTPEQRKIVPVLSQTLFKLKDLQATHSPAELKTIVNEQFAKQTEMKLAYFEIVDAETLASVSDFKKHTHVVACIAVELGSLRLIDNVVMK
jgi:pantoate--beta-alanine ligase